MNREKSKNKGFTLVEMLVVILIIGVLAAILIPALMSAQCRTKAGTAKSMIKDITQYLTMYRRDKGRYPPETPSAGSEPLYEALATSEGRGKVYHEFKDEYVQSVDDGKKIYSIFGKGNGYPDAYEIHYALPRGEDYKERWRYEGDNPSPELFNLTQVNLWTAGCKFAPDNEDKKAFYEINNFD